MRAPDLSLPGVDGLETCRRLRQLPYGKDVVVLVVTASDDPSIRQEVLLAGGDEVALKTPTLELLRVRVRTLLLKKRSESVPPKVPLKEIPERSLDTRTLVSPLNRQ